MSSSSSLSVFSEHPYALILAGFKDERGILRFLPSASKRTPGIRLSVKPRQPVVDELHRVWESLFEAYPNVCPRRPSLQAGFRESIHGLDLTEEHRTHLDTQHSDQAGENANTAQSASLFLTDVIDIKDSSAQASLQTMVTFPELLRAMPKERGRLTYLKAWQLLSDGPQANTKAVLTDDAIKLVTEALEDPQR